MAEELPLFEDREGYLSELGGLLLSVIAQRTMVRDERINGCKWRVSVGLPGTRLNSKPTSAVFTSDKSEDGTCEIFISPTIDDPVIAGLHMTFRLVQALYDTDKVKGCRNTLQRVGFVHGALSNTPPHELAGSLLRAAVEENTSILGAYPHAKLDPTRIRKQTTRNLKWHCSCGFTARITKAQVLTLTQTALCPAGCIRTIGDQYVNGQPLPDFVIENR